MSTSQIQTFGDISVKDQGSLIINQVIQIAVAEIKLRPFVAASPYLGLRYFEERSKDFFFGRDALVAQLLGMVAQRSLVLLAGASGSGKSSVVRAGLIPQLSERLPQARFRHLIMTPDDDPFAALQAALRSAGVAQAQLGRLESRTADAVIDALTALRPAGELWLLVVDQLEQIFTRCGKAAWRAEFLRGLAELAARTQAEIKTVLVMRSDFFDRLGPHPEFGALAQKNLLLVPDMQASELRVAIEQPAARNGVIFEEGLVEQIIAEVKGRPGALPLLQYTLNELWRTDDPTDDRVLNTKSYQLLGGIEGALTKRADAIYLFSDVQRQVARKDSERQAMRRLFLRVVDLTSHGVSAAAVSRRAALAEIEPAEERAIVDELVAEMLLVADAAPTAGRSPRDSGTTLEIAHEALLTGWARLRDWINDAREVVYVRNRIAADAKSFAELREKSPAQAQEELWSGTRLANALELQTRGDFVTVLGGLSKTELAFLDASRAHRDERERARTRMRRIVISAAAGAACAILGTLGFALYAQSERARTEHENAQSAQLAKQTQERLTQEAEDAKQETQKQLQAALLEQGRQLLVEHKRPLRALPIFIKLQGDKDADPLLPYLLAGGLRTVAQTKAILRNPNGYVNAEFSPNGQEVLISPTALGKATICQVEGDACRALRASLKVPIIDKASYSADGRLILVQSTLGVQIIDSSSLEYLPPISSRDKGFSFNQAALSPDGRRVIAACSDKLARIYDARSGELVTALTGHGAMVNAARYSSEGQYILTTDNARLTILWDAATNKELQRFEKSVGSLSKYPQFSPDGKWVLTFDSAKSLAYLWRTDAKSAPVALQVPDQGTIWDANFSPDSQRIITATSENSARIYSLDGKIVARLRHPTSVSLAVFGPKGEQVVTVDTENVIRTWDAETNEVLGEYHGSAQMLESISFSPDGKKVLSVGFDKTARILDLNVGQVVPDNTRGRAFVQVAFSPDGATVAAIHETKDAGDKMATVWDAKTGRRLGSMRPNKWFQSLAYSPDGQYLIISDGAMVWKVLEVKTGRERDPIPVDGYPGPMRFSPSGKLMLFQLGMGPAQIFDSHTIANLADPASYKEVTRIDPGEGTMKIPPAPFRADGDQVLVFGGTAIAGFSIATRKVEYVLKDHRRPVAGAMFSPDGKRIISFGGEEIFAWDADTHQRIPEFAPLSLNPRQVLFSLDGSKLLVLDRDSRIVALSAKSGQILYELPEKSGDEFVLSPDRLRMAMVDRTGRQVQLWDVESGRQLDTLQPPGFEVRLISFDPRGRRLLAAGSGMVIYEVGAEHRSQEKLSRLLDCFRTAPGTAKEDESPSPPDVLCTP